MKGIVFTEFLEMVEDKFGPKVADEMIVGAAIPTGGVYTSVGTYDHRELVSLVIQLSKLTNIGVNDLVQAFGKHLFGRFSTLFPKFFAGVNTTFQFLGNVDSYIHPEVRKLYPDAELPRFEAKPIDANRMELIYTSSRHFADLAEGLIRGCVDHFGESMDLKREAAIGQHGEGIRFTLTRKCA